METGSSPLLAFLMATSESATSLISQERLPNDLLASRRLEKIPNASDKSLTQLESEFRQTNQRAN
jgi:hypothetical protein